MWLFAALLEASDSNDLFLIAFLLLVLFTLLAIISKSAKSSSQSYATISRQAIGQQAKAPSSLVLFLLIFILLLAWIFSDS